MDVDTNTFVTGEEPPIPEEEDFVVREIDVYFYPPTPPTPSEITVRPSTTDVEIDLSVDVDSPYFDKDAPSANRFDELTLTSKWRPYVQTSAYAIRVFTGNELHLNPVFAVRKLRPSMDYLYPSASKNKNVSEVATTATTSKAESSGNPNKAMEQKDNEPFVPFMFNDSNSNLSADYRRRMFDTEKPSSLTFPIKPSEYLRFCVLKLL